MEFDDIFHEVGSFGKHQMILLIWLSLLMGWPASPLSNIYFLMELPFSCSLNASIEPDRNATLIYPDNVVDALPNPRGPCFRYSGNETKECTNWDFDHSDYGRTPVENFQLVCSRSWLKSFGNTMAVVGKMFGTAFLGHISDRFGRMRTVMVSGMCHVVFWSISIASPYYPMYAVTRLLAAAFTTGAYSAGFVYLMEMVAPSKRLLVGQLYNCSFNLGYMLLSGLAYLVKDSIHSELLCVVPFSFFLIFSVFAPESPRWLLVNDQQEKAAKVLNQMKRINYKTPTGTINIEQIIQNAVEDNETGTMLDVFRSKVLLKRTLILLSYWMSANLLYFALVYNSAALIPGNFYINNFLLAAVGLPATVIGLVLCGWKRTGRRLTCCLMMIIPGAIGFICIPCTIYELGTAVRVLSILGKLFVGVAFDVIYLFTAELYPTEVRSSAFGFCSTCGRVGSIFATFVGSELASLWLPLPYVVFGLFGTISGSLCLLLPETHNRKLSETMQEVEEQQLSGQTLMETNVR